MNAFKPIQDLLEQGVSDGVFTGAQAAVCLPESEPDVICVGSTKLHDGMPVVSETIFDLASLTKLFVVSTVLRLADDGWFTLHAPLREIFHSQLSHSHLAGATMAQLLAHEAGLKAWEPFYDRVDIQLRGTPSGREAIVGMALAEEPECSPGTRAVYSDLGYIILGALLPDVTGESLEAMIQRQVTGPLGLESIDYRPLETSQSDDNSIPFGIAATENCPWRKKVIVGEVHDDNAWTMGGVAGHAGLFGSVGDVSRFGAAWLEAIDQSSWLGSEIAAYAVSRRELGRGLGWDTVTRGASSAGSLISDTAFGHLGFTGCSLWVDPESRVSIALLTNRVHPVRENDAIRTFRPRFHDEVMRIVG